MPDPILVQHDEDVSDVLGRLRGRPERELRLVVPADAALAESRFNFQLLAIHAEDTGRRLVVESDDERVLALAAGAGLATAGAAGTALAPLAAATVTAAAAGRVSPDEPIPPFEELEGYPDQDGWPEDVDQTAGSGGPSYQPRYGPWRPESLASGSPRGGLGARGTRRLIFYAAAAAILLIGMVAVVLLVPSATVTLTTSSQQFSTPVDMVAQPNSATGGITVRMQTVEKQISGAFQATGSRDTPGAKATGTVKYLSNCGPLALQVNKGAVLTSQSGVAFVQQQTVTVGAEQSQTAPIQAQSAGVNGNVAANQITAMQNAGIYASCLKITNPAATTGGQDAKHQALVTQKDVEAAQAQLAQQAEQSIQSQLAADVRSGEKQSDQNPVQFGTPDFFPDHPVGSAVDHFNATLTLSGTSTYYRPAQVSSAFWAALEARVPAGRQLTPDDFVAQYQTTAAAGGGLEFKGQATGRTAPKLDLGAIQKRLAGRTTGSADAYLHSLPVSSSWISQSPLPFPMMPLLASRISVDYVIQQPVAPAPSPGTPAGSSAH